MHREKGKICNLFYGSLMHHQVRCRIKVKLVWSFTPIENALVASPTTTDMHLSTRWLHDDRATYGFGSMDSCLLLPGPSLFLTPLPQLLLPHHPPPPIPFLPPHPHCLLTTFLLTSFSFLCSSVLYLSQKEEWGRKVVQEEGREGVMVHCSGREGEDQFDWSP